MEYYDQIKEDNNLRFEYLDCLAKVFGKFNYIIDSWMYRDIQISVTPWNVSSIYNIYKQGFNLDFQIRENGTFKSDLGVNIPFDLTSIGIRNRPIDYILDTYRLNFNASNYSQGSLKYNYVSGNYINEYPLLDKYRIIFPGVDQLIQTLCYTSDLERRKFNGKIKNEIVKYTAHLKNKAM